jgi:Fe-S-cluster containining protein
MKMNFFDEGLKFECRRCGQCCSIPDGYVFVDSEEISDMVSLLGISVEEFARLYLMKLDGEIVLKSFPNGECIFFERNDAGCRFMIKDRAVQNISFLAREYTE